MEKTMYYKWVKLVDLQPLTKEWLDEHKPVFKASFMDEEHVFTHMQVWKTDGEFVVFHQDNLIGAGAVIIPCKDVKVLILTTPEVEQKTENFDDEAFKLLDSVKYSISEEDASDLQIARKLFGANKLQAIRFVLWLRRLSKGEDKTLRGVKNEIDTFYSNWANDVRKRRKDAEV